MRTSAGTVRTTSLGILIYFHWFVVNPTGYHWDISDWIPSVQLCHVQGPLHSDFVQTPPPGYIRPTSIDTDYLTSGIDIEVTPASQYPTDVQLPPVPRLPESYSPTLPRRDAYPSANRESSNCSEKAHCLMQRTRLATPVTQTQAVPQGSVSGPSDFRPNVQDRHCECLAQDDGDDSTFSICLPMRSCSDVSAYGDDCDYMLSDSESSEGGHSSHQTPLTQKNNG